VVSPASRLDHVRATGGAVGGLVAGASPWVPGGSACSLAALTPARLTAALAGDTGAVVRATRALGHTAGTTDRTRLAIDWDDAGREAGLPASVFVKATACSAKNRALAAFLDMVVQEVTFYRTARDQVPEVAPRAHLAAATSGGRFLLVLDDLVEAGCELAELGFLVDLHYVEALIDALAVVHARFWASARFDADLAWVRPQTRRVGFAAETVLFRSARRARVRSGELSDDLVCLARLLSRETWALAEIWERGPLTLCHGDTHSGNTFRRPDGTAGFVDWQVVHAAHGLRDVAYLLVVSLETELRRSQEVALLERYLARLRDAGVDAPSFDEAWARYRLYAVDGWDATAVTMTFAGLQERRLVERSHALASRAVLDLDSLGAVRAALAGDLW
jgi:hypothetical protein